MEEDIQPRRYCVLHVKCPSFLPERVQNYKFCMAWGWLQHMDFQENYLFILII